MIVNLNQYRKKRRRAEAETQAKENRVRFGRSKEERIAELNAAHIWDRPIVTEVVPFQAFYPAEDYHQGYYRGNPAEGYCQVVVSPKVAKFRKAFAAKLRPV